MNDDKVQINKRFSLLIILTIILLFGGCSGKNGFFGFGKDSQNIRTYRVIPVFQASESLYWVYQLKSLSSPNLFGVKLERNELGWLNLQTLSLKADKEFKVLSYHYPPMKPGLYKITIYHKMKILDQGLFRLIEK